MVAPLVAGVARAGAAMTRGAATRTAMTRSAGGTLMHSRFAGAKSVGSSMLSSGQVPWSKVSKEMGKLTNMIIDQHKKANAYLGKISGVLGKHSPAWVQQMIVLKKAFGLFLRPIGDILARFVRPMAIAFLKLATWFYKLFGTGGAAVGSTAYLEDEIKNLEVAKETAMNEGRFDDAAAIQEQINDKQAQIKKNTEDAIKWLNLLVPGIGRVSMGLGSIWEDDLKPAFLAMSGWAQDIWDTYIAPGFDSAKTWASDIWEKIKGWFTKPEDGDGGDKPEGGGLKFDPLEDFKQGWENLKFASKTLWDEYIAPGWEGAKTWGTDLWNDTILPGMADLKNWGTAMWATYIDPFGQKMLKWGGKMWDDYIHPGWQAAKGWAKTIWDDYINVGWEGAKNWASKIWRMIVSYVKNKISDEEGDKAVGGAIQKTGRYLLHAGERVVTAGDVSRANTSPNLSVTNHFNISATINNDMDIRELARQLADLNETELRRRVSY